LLSFTIFFSSIEVLKMIFYKLLVLTVFLFSFEVLGFEECGTVKEIENRILGGIQSKRGRWPFLAALYYTEGSKFFCGSSLISTKHVLTGDLFERC
jgi:secreted trypsin-like serine protease